MEPTIDGLTLKEVMWNIYAFTKDMNRFARKVERARLDHTRAKWQKKYANAAGYLADNKERLARFGAVEQGVEPTCQECGFIKGHHRIGCSKAVPQKWGGSR
jgi:hypothetical protein